jgi:hypothetical protein
LVVAEVTEVMDLHRTYRVQVFLSIPPAAVRVEERIKTETAAAQVVVAVRIREAPQVTTTEAQETQVGTLQ